MLLLDLSDDVTTLIAEQPFTADDLLTVLRLAATCTSLHKSLAAMRGKCAAQRLAFLPEHVCGYQHAGPQSLAHGCYDAWAACREVLSCDRTNTDPCGMHFNTAIEPVRDSLAAFCCVMVDAPHLIPVSQLPTSGSCRWDVTINRCFMSAGCLVIGVCDADATCGWGLMPHNGEIWRKSREATLDHLSRFGPIPPPKGFPDGHEKKIQLNHWRDWPILGPKAGQANGTVITCILDCDMGSLNFRVDGGPLCFGLAGFPKGKALRPWVWLYCGNEDAVTISPRVHLTKRSKKLQRALTKGLQLVRPSST